MNPEDANPEVREDKKGDYIECFLGYSISRAHWWQKTFFYRMEHEPSTHYGLLDGDDEPLTSWIRYRDWLAGLNNPPEPPEPNLPVPPHPAENDLPTVGVRFEWAPSMGAYDYHLQVQRPDSSVVLNVFTTDPFYETGPGSPLQVGSTYKWIVKARNAQLGSSNWSAENYFDVVSEFTHVPAAQPVTAGPSGCIGTLQPTFDWSYPPPPAPSMPRPSRSTC